MTGMKWFNYLTKDNPIVILGGLPTATRIIEKNMRSVNFQESFKESLRKSLKERF